MSEITEKQDYTDDICTHKDVDCNCMTAREKRMDRQIDHLTTSRANLKSALEKIAETGSYDVDCVDFIRNTAKQALDGE